MRFMLVPKLQQRVAIYGLPGAFLVAWVDRYRDTADVVALDEAHGAALLRDIPFTDLLPVDESKSP
jgi:hypothetical protein